ncbi:unnamed protein product, partial [Adineta steineri]
MSNQLHTSSGIDSLVKHTAEMVDMTLTSSNANQRHVEYLPYPDWNFVEELDTPCQDDQCPLDQVYTRRNKTFVRGLPVEVTKIEAERVYNPVTEFLYPYLY